MLPGEGDWGWPHREEKCEQRLGGREGIIHLGTWGAAIAKPSGGSSVPVESEQPTTRGTPAE